MHLRSRAAGMHAEKGREDMAKKILIMDDDPIIVDYLADLFRDNGYETISANNGKDGMAKVKSEHPDLVVLDISMPEQSGMGFYEPHLLYAGIGEYGAER